VRCWTRRERGKWRDGRGGLARYGKSWVFSARSDKGEDPEREE